MLLPSLQAVWTGDEERQTPYLASLACGYPYLNFQFTYSVGLPH